VKAKELEVESVSPGMAVWSLDDRRLGTVSAVNECCFRFEAEETRRKVSVTSEGIFNISFGRVALIYVANERHRYSCAGHPTEVVVLPPPDRQRRARSAV
jgi:hypothetical protein